MTQISRRNFLRLSAMAIAGTLVTACVKAKLPLLVLDDEHGGIISVSIKAPPGYGENPQYHWRRFSTDHTMSKLAFAGEHPMCRCWPIGEMKRLHRAMALETEGMRWIFSLPQEWALKG